MDAIGTITLYNTSSVIDERQKYFKQRNEAGLWKKSKQKRKVSFFINDKWKKAFSGREEMEVIP